MGKIKIIDLKQPDIRPVKESGDIYSLWDDYTFKIHLDSGVHTFKIEKEFHYDGASVPRWAWRLIGFLPDGIHRPAALVHDWLYVSKGHVQSLEGKEVTLSQRQMDQIFKAMLDYLGVKSWHASLAYAAVRALGWIYWNTN